jgi:O-methyltransferase involved in polyketide biosynthesis
MALFRALESARPARDRLFDDPYAGNFLRPWAHAVATAARLALAQRLIVRIIDRTWPGARTSAIGPGSIQANCRPTLWPAD